MRSECSLSTSSSRSTGGRGTDIRVCLKSVYINYMYSTYIIGNLYGILPSAQNSCNHYRTCIQISTGY